MFKSRKKSFGDGHDNERPTHLIDASPPPLPISNTSTMNTRGLTFRRKKKTSDTKPVFDLASALPATDNFRTSLLMPKLTARFSMLKEADDPSSLLGKAADDSVVPSRRVSRLNIFDDDYNGSTTDFSLFARPRAPFMTERALSIASDGYATDDDGSASIMSRAKPEKGNKFFGGRQKVYKIPVNGSASGKDSSHPGSPQSKRLGRQVYEDDVSLSEFRAMDSKTKQDQDGNSRDDESDKFSFRTSGEELFRNSKRETSSSNGSLGLDSRISATPTSLNGSLRANSPPALKSSAVGSFVKSKQRLYGHALDQQLQEQQQSTLQKLDTFRSGPRSTKSSPHLNDRFARAALNRPQQDSPPLSFKRSDSQASEHALPAAKLPISPPITPVPDARNIATFESVHPAQATRADNEVTEPNTPRASEKKQTILSQHTTPPNPVERARQRKTPILTTSPTFSSKFQKHSPPGTANQNVASSPLASNASSVHDSASESSPSTSKSSSSPATSHPPMHYRQASDQSSVYSDAPGTRSRSLTLEGPQDPLPAVVENAEPAQPDYLSALTLRSQQMLAHARQVKSGNKYQLPKSMPAAPEPHPAIAASAGTAGLHIRMESTESQREAQDFASELADRRRKVEESLKQIGMPTNPAPRAAEDPASSTIPFGLKKMSSRASLRRGNELQTKAGKPYSASNSPMLEQGAFKISTTRYAEGEMARALNHPIAAPTEEHPASRNLDSWSNQTLYTARLGEHPAGRLKRYSPPGQGQPTVKTDLTLPASSNTVESPITYSPRRPSEATPPVQPKTTYFGSPRSVTSPAVLPSNTSNPPSANTSRPGTSNSNSNQAAVPQSTFSSFAHRKRSVSKADISRPTFISGTSSQRTVDLATATRQQLDEGAPRPADPFAPPVPPFHPRRLLASTSNSNLNSRAQSRAPTPPSRAAKGVDSVPTTPVEERPGSGNASSSSGGSGKKGFLSSFKSAAGVLVRP